VSQWCSFQHHGVLTAFLIYAYTRPFTHWNGILRASISQIYMQKAESDDGVLIYIGHYSNALSDFTCSGLVLRLS